jgi:cytoskeletal protein RodZ
MNDFKEWLSDYLRYFLLAFIILLIIAAAILGVSIYSKVVKGSSNQKEPVQQTASAMETEDTKATEEESETEEASETIDPSETEEESQKQTETEAVETEAPQTETAAPQTEAPATEAPVTEAPQTEPQTEAKPVYLTMQGSCYLRAEPSVESEIIGEYWAGTTVEFLEDVGGWYKVRVDGKTGYMGARFF